jgi:acrylyl-CoA reductase (NADPH)
VMPFILRGVSLLGIHSVEMPRAWRLDIWKHLAGDWKPAQLAQIASRTVSLDEVPEVSKELIASQVLGRAIVRIGGDL